MPRPAAAHARARGSVVDPFSGSDAAAASANLTAYELERMQRIERNRQKLVSLGLDETPELLAAPKKQVAPGKRRKADAGGGGGSAPPPEPRQPPSRQSKRQRGEAPEIAPPRREQRRDRREQRRDRRGRAEDSEEEDGLQGRRQPRNAASEHRAQRQSVKADKGDVAAHHDLNNYRIVTMTDRALVNRARRISNLGKLRSFIQVLDACGMAKVAAEARERLQELGAGEEADG